MDSTGVLKSDPNSAALFADGREGPAFGGSPDRLCYGVQCRDGIMRQDVQGSAGVSKRKSLAYPPDRT